MGKMFQAATNYLPAQVSGMMNQDRAFATVRLNISGQRNICALSTYVLTSAASQPHQPLSRHNYLCPTPPPWPLISHPSRAAGVCCVCALCLCAVSVCEQSGLTMLFSLGFRSCLGCW